MVKLVTSLFHFLSGKPMTLGASKHRALALVLFLLAALIALASGLAGPTSASAKTPSAPQKCVWENSAGTAQSRPIQMPQSLELQRKNSIGRYNDASGCTLAAENTVSEASNVIQGQNLARQLTSEEQMGQALVGEGQPMAGAGAGTPLRDAQRLASQYGGSPQDWAKMGGESSAAHGVQTPEGNNFEIHWYQNFKTGQVVEIKTKITGH